MFDTITAIESFKNNIINIINDSCLSVGCAYYVLKDILLKLQDTYYETYQNEQKNLEQEITETTEQIPLFEINEENIVEE